MEHYIPKTDQPSPSKIENFRPVALLNVEGKLSFSFISKRLEKHIIANNKLINASVQKGCMEEVPSCCEHMFLVWGALKETRCNKLNVAKYCWILQMRMVQYDIDLFSLHWRGMVSTNTGYP